MNIEGLAIKAVRLYFGFRGPVGKGAGLVLVLVLVLAVDTEALFGRVDSNP